MSKKKDILILVLKCVVSFSLLGFILCFKIPLKDIKNVIISADIGWILVSFSLHSLGLLISAVRWKILITAQDDDASLLFLLKSYLVGSFFNNLLPTRIGGDAVRIWDGSKLSRSMLKSLAIVLVERLTGILILLFFALGAAAFRIETAKNSPVIWVALILGGAGIAFILFFFSPLTVSILRFLPDKKILVKIKQKAISLRETVLSYRRKKKELARAMFWALLLQINVILHFFLIGKALKLSIGIVDYFIFIPLVLLIQLIPVTINGLGLREGAYLEIFSSYGIAGETAIAFSFIDLAFMLIVGIIGGIIYVTRK